MLPLPFDWADEVHIYVTTSFGDMGALLSNTKNLNYDITYNGKTEPSYKLNGLHIEYFSIILSSDLKNTDKYYIAGVIKHEMKHAYDIIRKNFMADDLNRDIKYFYDTLDSSDIKFLTNYYAYSKEDLKTFISRLDVSEVYALFRDMIYYLNSSEMSARLVNFDSDVDNLLKNQKPNDFGSTSIGIYLGLKNIMQGLNQYITPQEKKSFSEQYMIEFNKVYGNSDKPRLFKHYGKFDERSFNYLTAFFLKKINTFIYKCHSIYTNKCEEHMPHSSLSWQNVLYLSTMNALENINNKN